MEQHGLADWFQHQKDEWSLLRRGNQTLEDICCFPLKQTAFPAVFYPLSASAEDMQAEID
ncbi:MULTISPECIES: hypothetical protein [Shouchella]|uniref:Uncharacterized protein n=1 Tax=Shouchella hunanensis TaxID=766894 RepID=A0ABY7W611_9BACI|nr:MULTISPECIES: hypothetical protein [Shouchella]WDF03526.1 hypothetical protein PQ477_18855 [Shouchella hunanensis]GAF23943.1 hypothetical protein JCM19047_3798 [Bacillus sp. JCM 19047]